MATQLAKEHYSRGRVKSSLDFAFYPALAITDYRWTPYHMLHITTSPQITSCSLMCALKIDQSESLGVPALPFYISPICIRSSLGILGGDSTEL